jgi:hypothetical protein
VFPHFDNAPRDGASTDFSFVNIIEHKAKEITGFYGVREHTFKCLDLPRKPRLNRVFDALRHEYTEQSDPSPSQVGGDVTVGFRQGRGARGRRGRD